MTGSGALIKQARRRAGLSQVQLAERAGTAQPVISAYERGHREPTLPTLQRMVAASGHRLKVTLGPDAMPDLPPPADDAEHGTRLIDLLGLADAIPHRRTGALPMPILRSRIPR